MVSVSTQRAVLLTEEPQDEFALGQILLNKTLICGTAPLECVRTRLSVSYGANEAVVGEMNGLDSAGGLVVSKGHQGGVVNHLGEPRRWRVPGETVK